MGTFMLRKEDVKRQWYVVNAKDKILGRLASQVAIRLMGKHKPAYTPHVDTGDYIIIINADKIKLTGNKWDKKRYYWHSGYIGGLKSLTYDKLLERHPELLLKLAVKRMLPKNRLGRQMLKKMKVYAGANHPHKAQRPIELDI
ncbi:MAG: 50S ribosomal protein L13 [Syntrophobacter sp. DG_60]|nr:MAG: 50S ribosomal protein L13 [Syntrophobacter sp. DG_60]